MNKLLLTTAIIMAMGSSVAFAHHPAADVVDEEIYELIEENISDVHVDMTFDDMGGDTTDVGSAAEARDADVGVVGVAPGGDLADVGAEMSGDLEDVGAAMETREVESSMADAEPSGPMSAQM